MSNTEGKKQEGMTCLISLNFSSASGAEFLSGWYCEAMTSEMRWSPARGMMSEGKTDLHGGLAVRLLEICVVNIYGHSELTRFAR